MACNEWRDNVQAYADGELPAAERHTFEEHWRTCSACASAALGALAMKRAVRQAGRRFVPSAALHRRVEERVTGGKPSRVRTWLPACAAAAAIVLVGFLGAQRWAAESRRQALTELTDLHVTTLASSSPVDVAISERHTVKPWFAGRIPFTFNLPELQGTPFTLLGGRVTYLQQVPGAHLLFRVRQHRISVFIFRDQDGASPSLARTGAARHSAFNVETWDSGGLRYIVVGDPSAEDIHALSELLKAAAR
jgi:anti-sigma factor RsiW